jgi:tripartite-type tricarboxylate transporter receptor subunit TctC
MILRLLKFQAVAALVATGMLASGLAAAQAFPSKPIRIILSYTHGGPTDLLSRAVGEKVSASLGQPVLVESRAGAHDPAGRTGALGQPFAL